MEGVEVDFELSCQLVGIPRLSSGMQMGRLEMKKKALVFQQNSTAKLPPQRSGEVSVAFKIILIMVILIGLTLAIIWSVVGIGVKV